MKSKSFKNLSSTPHQSNKVPVKSFCLFPSFFLYDWVGLSVVGKHVIGLNPLQLNKLNTVMDTALRGHPYVKSAIGAYFHFLFLFLRQLCAYIILYFWCYHLCNDCFHDVLLHQVPLCLAISYVTYSVVRAAVCLHRRGVLGYLGESSGSTGMRVIRRKIR